jgi:hypothetical protein
LSERANASMIHAPTSLSSWGLSIRSALEARGIDGAELFQRAGLDVEALADPDRQRGLAAAESLLGWLNRRSEERLGGAG